MPDQPSSRWRLVRNLFLLGVIALTMGFVIRSHLANHNQRMTSSPPLLESSFDVGRVLSGEVVSHAFVFTNETSESLTIRADKDIRKDCGCSKVEPEARELGAGASTKVVVTVATNGKMGRFSDGGIIAWSLPNGEKRDASFKLRGEARPSLKSEPTSLGFGPDEVNGLAVKELKFTASVPLDWAKAKVRGSSHNPRIQVIDWNAVGDTATCKVKCIMEKGVEAANGGITAEVPLAKPRPDFPSATIWVPVQGHQDIEFLVTPTQVPVKVDKVSGRASARLLVRGKKLVRPGQPIKAIACAGYQVDWRMIETSNGLVAIIALELTPTGEVESPGEPMLVIHVDGMEPIRLPVIRGMASGK